jgi:hypothetical protein
MHYTIYKTTNLINGKIYIGKHQTLDPNDDYLGSGKQLNHAIQKYGKENFVKDVLHVFETEEEMNAKEKELVTEEFIKENTNYNQCPGGQGGWGFVNLNNLGGFNNLGHAKISGRLGGIALIGRNLSARHKQNVSNGMTGIQNFKGKHHSVESKTLIGEKSSIHQRGSGNSQYGSMWITNGSENKKIKKFDIIPEGWYKGRKLLHLSSNGKAPA